MNKLPRYDLELPIVEDRDAQMVQAPEGDYLHRDEVVAMLERQRDDYKHAAQHGEISRNASTATVCYSNITKLLDQLGVDQTLPRQPESHLRPVHYESVGGMRMMQESQLVNRGTFESVGHGHYRCYDVRGRVVCTVGCLRPQLLALGMVDRDAAGTSSV